MTTIIRDNLGLYENKLPQNLLVETNFRCDMFTDTNIGLIIVIRMICVPQFKWLYQWISFHHIEVPFINHTKVCHGRECVRQTQTLGCHKTTVYFLIWFSSFSILFGVCPSSGLQQPFQWGKKSKIDSMNSGLHHPQTQHKWLVKTPSPNGSFMMFYGSQGFPHPTDHLQQIHIQWEIAESATTLLQPMKSK